MGNIEARDVIAEREQAEKCEVCGNAKTDTPKRRKDGTAYHHSECHWPKPVIEAPVYLVHQNGEAEQIGKSFYCPAANCFKPQRVNGRSMIGRKNLPPDFNQQVWSLAHQTGAVYRIERGLGFYFARNTDETLGILAAGGPQLNFARVEKWIKSNTEIHAPASHGLARKEQMATTAYQPEQPEFPNVEIVDVVE